MGGVSLEYDHGYVLDQVKQLALLRHDHITSINRVIHLVTSPIINVFIFLVLARVLPAWLVILIATANGLVAVAKDLKLGSLYCLVFVESTYIQLHYCEDNHYLILHLLIIAASFAMQVLVGHLHFDGCMPQHTERLNVSIVKDKMPYFKYFNTVLLVLQNTFAFYINLSASLGYLPELEAAVQKEYEFIATKIEEAQQASATKKAGKKTKRS